tara:strand:- start:5607 stop:5756 length:150 start_codon:yes stop_codon:yes gene_type:complete
MDRRKIIKTTLTIVGLLVPFGLIGVGSYYGYQSYKKRKKEKKQKENKSE